MEDCIEMGDETQQMYGPFLSTASAKTGVKNRNDGSILIYIFMRKGDTHHLPKQALICIFKQLIT